MRNFRKGKPVTIQDIILTTEQRQKLRHAAEAKLVSHSRNTLVRRMLGGCCSNCADLPTKKVIFTLKDATLVEFYCDNCFNPRELKTTTV